MALVAGRAGAGHVRALPAERLQAGLRGACLRPDPPDGDGRVRASDARLAELRRPQQVPAYAAGLQQAQQRLADAQAESSDLAIELTRLRALQRTIGIARHNLTLTTPAPAPGQRASSSQMFERDQALATWLEGQIEQDLGYAQGAVERAREAQQVTQLRLQQQLAQLTRAQSRVALLQTSLVAALLASFTMINIFGIQLNLEEAVKVPLLATGVALLLALPPLAAHWFERYGLIDHLAAALCGGASGWLLAALITDNAANPVAVVTVVAGAACWLAPDARHDRRFRANLASDRLGPTASIGGSSESRLQGERWSSDAATPGARRVARRDGGDWSFDGPPCQPSDSARHRSCVCPGHRSCGSDCRSGRSQPPGQAGGRAGQLPGRDGRVRRRRRPDRDRLDRRGRPGPRGLQGQDPGHPAGWHRPRAWT